ncbi:ParM/StbA family protein [Nostoc sp. PCC 7107]|uniref:ParM/StbA family protein n=1 Tax=Nostoc sp. PCC 7107 TaxID=317936 RepID=UPI00029F29B1|nr:ParM/StbA family protein [Nostoc sp. PCC 7107]AFY43651.1 StbA family protein [Nostoc sp. PCC 7107]
MTLNAHIQPYNGFTSYPQNGHTRARVVFDGGNRFIKWLDTDNNVKYIPSCIKEVSEYQWKRLKPDTQSVLIEVDGKRYVIGRLAQQLNGEPTFQKDKCELAEILVLAAIQPSRGFDHVRIERLAIALPNSLNSNDVAAVQRIANHPLTREFIRDDRTITYTVGTVEPIDETYPAFLYAQKQGFYQFPEAQNAVWDIGGGTSIARIYTPNGTLLHDAEVILPGTKQLAQEIASELKESHNLDYSPSLTLIMDAIERRDYVYGTDQLDFWEIYDRQTSAWIETARAAIRSKWVNYLPELGHVLVVGGSAELARPICELTSDRFFIPDQPQFFNLIAMAHMD